METTIIISTRLWSEKLGKRREKRPNYVELTYEKLKSAVENLLTLAL
jgi:hypothetical protein